MSDIDTFFKNFSLEYVSMSPELHSDRCCSCSIAEARKSIVLQKKSSMSNRQFIEMERQYLTVIGEKPKRAKKSRAVQEKVDELLKANAISTYSYGFLKDAEQKARIERTKIEEENVRKLSFNELKRYCYAHGVHTTHDISLDEVQRMALWILRNESDQVSYTKMPEFMQQAIDLSVMAQNVDKLSENLSHDSRLTSLIRNHINESEEKLVMTKKSLSDAVQLNKLLVTEGRSIPAMRFQENAIGSLGSVPTGAQESVESEEPETADEEAHSN